MAGTPLQGTSLNQKFNRCDRIGSRPTSSSMSSAYLLASHSKHADAVLPNYRQQGLLSNNPPQDDPLLKDLPMDRAQVDKLHRLSETTTADPQIQHQKQPSAQWNDQPITDQLNKLSNGSAEDNSSKLSNGVPAIDGSRDEGKYSDDYSSKANHDTTASDDSLKGCRHCQHCQHGGQAKEHASIEIKQREITAEGRSRENSVVRSIQPVPITIKRKPFIARPDSKLRHAGTARAHIAATEDKPYGTTHKDWARNHSHQTVLQQHCDFFDTDRDGIIWPQDTFSGFDKLGFGIILSLVAVFVIHANFSYPTLPTWLPDPFFRVYLTNIHKDKHGSDSGTYDHEGRFVPQKFEDIFEKYAEGRDYVTIWDVSNMMKGQRCIADPIGWGGAFFEWLATYLMLWPEDGRMMKEDIRGIYDGSLFYKIAARRASNKAYGYE